MLKSYFKIAWRNVMKHKIFSFINVFGLSIGLTCCMLISLYLYHEYSYDSYHKNGDRLYQLGAIFGKEGEEERKSTVPAALTPALKETFPEIVEGARLLSAFLDDKTIFQYEQADGVVKSFYETKGYLADHTIFQLFTYHFVEGNPTTALVNPNTVVISEEIAKKLFGTTGALNKVIRISSSTNGDHDFLITGVFRPSVIPSHIDARFFMSAKGGAFQEIFENTTNMVNNNMFYTYFLLKEGTNPRQLEKKFPAFVESHMRAQLNERADQRQLFLTNVSDIHLHSGIESNVTPPGSLVYMRIMVSIAVLTLLIACINFMNLSTARSSKRSVEVGVRKVLGAEKGSLIWQFLGESIILALLAFIFALIFVQLLLPLFEEISGRAIVVSIHQYGGLLLVFVLLALATGLLAGSYPALYLSSFKPVRVLKGRFNNSFAATFLRKGLVIFQFVIAVVLIVASVIISEQMNYLRSKDLGFIKDKQIVIPLRSSFAKSTYFALKDRISNISHIQSIGGSAYYPGIFNPSDWLMYKEGSNMDKAKAVYINFVDYSFLQTLDIKSVAGRLFSTEFPADTNSHIIINEKAIAELGFLSAEDAIGKWVAFDWEGEQNRFEVVGVVNDFHFKDLHIPIEPFGFLLAKNPYYNNYLIAHANKGSMGETLLALEQAWKSVNPNEPFEYSFLDQDFQKNYKAENRLASMIGYFTFIAILISCMGLFGLVTFSAEQRIKEIGIRKVLGAKVSSLVALLSYDFLKLIIAAIIVASPIAWYVMDKWLQTFAYKVSISWHMFAVTTGAAILIAVITISYQAIKTALSNPVKSLRTE